MKLYHSVFAMLLAVMASCKTVPTIEPSTGASSAAITSIVDHTSDSVTIIKRDAGRILLETQSIREIYSIESVENDESMKDGVADLGGIGADRAAQFLNHIDSKATNIIESADSIGKEVEKLQSLTAEVNKLEKSLTNLQVALDQTKAKALEKLYGYISMFWVIGFLLIAGGAAVAFFLNKGYGASLGLIGLLMIGFASAAQYYMEEIARVGAILLIIGFLSAIGMIAWSTINSKRNATAIREIVEMIQILKETMTDSEKERIFGQNGVASTVQSDLTKEIITKIREQNGFKKLEAARVAARTASTSSNDSAGVTGSC
jgi:flagellin-specific chaperone FliS